jgi:hypothetical protein
MARINYNRGIPAGIIIAANVRNMVIARDQFKELYDDLSSMTAGGTDYAAVATFLSKTEGDVSAQDAQDLMAKIDLWRQDMETAMARGYQDLDAFAG